MRGIGWLLVDLMLGRLLSESSYEWKFDIMHLMNLAWEYHTMYIVADSLWNAMTTVH